MKSKLIALFLIVGFIFQPIAFSAIVEDGTGSTTQADVDNGNLHVVLPTTASQAGYAQTVYTPTSTITKINRITRDNGAYTAIQQQLFDLDFNSASTTWAAKIGTNATTMAKAVTNGFMRLNSGNVTTINIGISIYSNRTFNVESGSDLRVRGQIRHSNFDLANKEAYFGLGYYAFAANQAAVNNEFIGFKWTTGGLLQGVVTSSTGGAGADQTVALSVQTNSVTHEYEVVINDNIVEFWIDGVYQNKINRPTDQYGLLKTVSMPVIARLFNSGSAPSSAPLMDIADISVVRVGPDENMPYPTRMASMGKSSYYFQPDITSASTATHNVPASTTLPTAATGSNTASVLNATTAMGGFYRMNGASFNVATHSNVLVAAYQNPAVPTTAGSATNARNFYVTSISVAPQIITTALTGGPYTAIWFAAIGATATSLATADADGTTAVAQKAPRFIPLPRTTGFAATAALGVVETGSGDTTFNFPTPLVVHPGEFLSIGQRLITITAVTAGTIDGAISVNGYWD